MTELKTRIKELRLENGLTLKKLGDEVGVKDSTLSQYENDKRTVPYEVLIKLSIFFECSADYLLRKPKSYDNLNLKTVKFSRIKKLREENNLSQKELAKKINIPATTIELYETGNSFPRIDVWEDMAKVFDVDVPYLQGFTPEKDRKTNYEWNHLNKKADKQEIINDDTTSTNSEVPPIEAFSERFSSIFDVAVEKVSDKRTSISFPKGSMSDDQLRYVLGIIAKFIVENDDYND